MKINFTIKDIKNYLEDYHCWFWFDNSVYDENIKRFRPAQISDFDSTKPTTLRLISSDNNDCMRKVLITNTQFIHFSANGQKFDNSSDWVEYLSRIKQQSQGVTAVM